MKSYLIKGAVLPSGEIADIAVGQGKFRAVGVGAADSLEAGYQVIDADGLQALPGLVDLHTHLRQPGQEDSLLPSS